MQLLFWSSSDPFLFVNGNSGCSRDGGDVILMEKRKMLIWLDGVQHEKSSFSTLSCLRDVSPSSYSLITSFILFNSLLKIPSSWIDNLMLKGMLKINSLIHYPYCSSFFFHHSQIYVFRVWTDERMMKTTNLLPKICFWSHCLEVA